MEVSEADRRTEKGDREVIFCLIITVFKEVMILPKLVNRDSVVHVKV